MMTCGHAANAQRRNADGTTVPSCVICGVTTIATAAPDLSGRVARCSYYGRMGRINRRPTTVCRSEQPSATTLAFFTYRGPGTTSYKGEAPHDEFYCGCMGWD